MGDDLPYDVIECMMSGRELGWKCYDKQPLKKYTAADRNMPATCRESIKYISSEY